MKKQLSAAVLLCLLACAASAQALPVSFDVVGYFNPNYRASVQADYDALNAVLSFNILNTSTAQGTITGFAFNLPGDGAGILSVTNDSANPFWHLLNQPLVANHTPAAYGPPNSINLLPISPVPSFDVGVGTGPMLAGGILPWGIGVGGSEAFLLRFTGPGTAALSTGALMALLAQDPNPPFGAFFQPSPGALGGNMDLATPTPIPGAVWLLGSGLLGLLGLKRRRKAA